VVPVITDSEGYLIAGCFSSSSERQEVSMPGVKKKAPKRAAKSKSKLKSDMKKKAPKKKTKKS
jgi:hypothetical protein